ncbi:MAG: ABC transporter C-terminal domain-containing protein, partial [Acidobacteria bacterium]|nr:ABC transporter C-terminal domain-containing protein [Acidobacteriota bacterium]
PRTPHPGQSQPKASYEDKKRADAEARRKRRAEEERQTRIGELEQRIAAHETEIKALEARMANPGFYDDRATADAAVARHQQLMWEVGDLMNRWEALQDS